MNNLKRIRNHKKGGADYLGVLGSFLIETLDDDIMLLSVAPRYFQYWDASQARLYGRDARLILKSFRNNGLVIIKSTREQVPKLVVLKGPSNWLNSDLVDDIIRLASHRWPKMPLVAKIGTIKKICPGAVDLFKRSGWIDSPRTGMLQIQLYQK
jgi:hypothetical protein